MLFYQLCTVRIILISLRILNQFGWNPQPHLVTQSLYYNTPEETKCPYKWNLNLNTKYWQAWRTETQSWRQRAPVCWWQKPLESPAESEVHWVSRGCEQPAVPAVDHSLPRPGSQSHPDLETSDNDSCSWLPGSSLYLQSGFMPFVTKVL